MSIDTEPRNDNILRDSDVTVDADLESVLDIIDIINGNFVAEVEEELARSGKLPPRLATLH
jgi:hypothetical protein